MTDKDDNQTISIYAVREVTDSETQKVTVEVVQCDIVQLAEEMFKEEAVYRNFYYLHPGLAQLTLLGLAVYELGYRGGTRFAWTFAEAVFDFAPSAPSISPGEPFATVHVMRSLTEGDDVLVSKSEVPLLIRSMDGRSSDDHDSNQAVVDTGDEGRTDEVGEGRGSDADSDGGFFDLREDSLAGGSSRVPKQRSERASESNADGDSDPVHEHAAAGGDRVGRPATVGRHSADRTPDVASSDEFDTERRHVQTVPGYFSPRCRANWIGCVDLACTCGCHDEELGDTDPEYVIERWVECGNDCVCERH